MLQISMLVKEPAASGPEEEEEEEMMFFSLCSEMRSSVSRNTSSPRNSHTYTYTSARRPGTEEEADGWGEEEVGENLRKEPSSPGETPAPFRSSKGGPDPDILRTESKG